MGEVYCDMFYNTDERASILIRFIDTANEKITNFTTFERENFPEIFHKITDVIFFNGNMPTFPRELSEFFPNLKFIFIYDCNMTTMSKDDLKGFNKLEKLMINHNKIKFLPGNLFDYTPDILEISFVDNKITKVGPEIFDNLKNLEEADFGRNSRINYRYQKGRTSLEKLKRIIRSNCKLVESLIELTTSVILDNLNKDNAEDTLMIARHLGLASLAKSVAIYMNLNCIGQEMNKT